MSQALDNLSKERTAVMYLRAASADRQDQRHDIAEQRDACTREAERLDAIVVKAFVDGGVSGNTTNRRGLRRLLQWITERPVRYVIVRDSTRLARNPVDDAAIRQRLDQAGVTLVSASDGASPTVDELLRSMR